MEFTTDKVGQFWQILTGNSTPQQKKEADNYLTQFQKSPNSIEVCLDLFLQNDFNSKVASSFLLYQIIRSQLNSLSESKERLSLLKDVLLTKFLPNVSGCPELVVRKLCFAVSLLVLAGVLSHWQNAIEELLSYSTQSDEKCFYSMIILSNLNAEYSSIQLNQKTSFMIKDALIDKKDLIKNFIFSIVNKSSSISDNDIRKRILDTLMQLTQSWVEFGLNILQMDQLPETFINQITTENIDKISELLSDSISNTSSSKIYSRYPPLPGKELQFIDNILNKVDKTELRSVKQLMQMITNFVSNYQENSDIDDVLLIGVANIFSSICENFVFLFFIKDELSQRLFQMLYYFISHKKRKISYKFFETITEMREYINIYYKFTNYTKEEKIQFAEFLLMINEAIMINSKLKTLEVNCDLMLKKDILCLNLTPQTSIEVSKSQNANDFENDANEVNVNDYRKSADDVFYNIFVILVQNFGEEGGRLYLSKITSILLQGRINEESVLSDQNRLLAVETAFYVMRSIADSFNTLQISSQPILDFIRLILSSYLIKNKQMVVNFLQFLDQASGYIPTDTNVYELTIKFLLTISEDESLQKCSTLIIYNITLSSQESNVELFKLIYNFYIQHYDNFRERDACSNISLALCCCLGGREKAIDNVKEMGEFYSLVMQPASERLKKVLEYFKGDNISSKVKMEILKDYQVHQNVLKSAKNCNKELYYYLFSLHIRETFELTSEIFEKCSGKDMAVIAEVTNIYIENTNDLGSKSLLYFDSLTKLMNKAFISSSQNYKCLIVLKYLLSSYCDVSIENNRSVIDYFFNLSSQMVENIIKETKIQSEMLKIYAEFFYFVFPKLQLQNLSNFNIQVINKIVQVVLDALKAFTEAQLLELLLQALCALISNDYISKEIIQSHFHNILLTAFNQMEHYDDKCMKRFSYLISNAIGFDKNLTINSIGVIFQEENFRKVFQEQYAAMVVEYLTIFGDVDKKLERLTNIIIEIKQGKALLDSLTFFAMEIARKKMNFKNN